MWVLGLPTQPAGEWLDTATVSVLGRPTKVMAESVNVRVDQSLQQRQCEAKDSSPINYHDHLTPGIGEPLIVPKLTGSQGRPPGRDTECGAVGIHPQDGGPPPVKVKQSIDDF